VYLAARASNNLLRALPAGTAYFLGIVLITMCTGQLVHPQGRLARAALPYVVGLRWGWHRVERALERGQFSLDALFERAFTDRFGQHPINDLYEAFRPSEFNDARRDRFRFFKLHGSIGFWARNSPTDESYCTMGEKAVSARQ